MSTVSKKGNVWKKCDCKHDSTCRHPWHFYKGGRGPGRQRGSLDLLLGKHAPDRTTAQRWFLEEGLSKLKAGGKGVPAPPTVPPTEPTVRDLLEEKARQHPARGVASHIAHLCRLPIPGHRDRQPLGDWPASALTVVALKAFRRSRPPTAGNRDLGVLRKAYNDAILNGVVTSTPFRVNGVATFGNLAGGRRDRRLYPGEEAKLLAAATSQDMRDFIVAAIATATRKGELSTVQVHEVNFARNRGILLPASKTKTKQDRWVPILPELRAILDRRLRGPDGQPLPPHAYVFGDATGKKVANRKTAFRAIKLRANGYGPPTFVRVINAQTGRAKRRLSPDSQAALATINLHWHDLRREGASRWLDSGVVSLEQIRLWLGHATLTQTATYLRASLSDGDAAMARYAEHRKTEAHGGALWTGDAHPGPENAPEPDGKPPVSSMIH